MFGIDWNMDGEVDITEDFLTMVLLNEESEESKEDEQNEGE